MHRFNMMPTLDDHPFYRHDCAGCRFLGSFAARDGTVWDGRYDLYCCSPDHHVLCTVIARYGNDGSQYLSGMTFASPWRDLDGVEQPAFPPLAEARRRAIQCGLIRPTIEERVDAANAAIRQLVELRALKAKTDVRFRAGCLQLAADLRHSAARDLKLARIHTDTDFTATAAWYRNRADRAMFKAAMAADPQWSPI